MAPRKKVPLNKPVIRRSSQAAAKKPIISIGTLVTVVVLAALVLLGVYLSRQSKTAEAEATPAFEEFKPLFNESDPTLVSIEIALGEESEGEAVKLIRDEKNIWVMELPAQVEADQGAVESAAAQVSALQVIDTLTDAKPADFGFTKPAYIVTLEFSGGKSYVIEVGDASPINTGYYVRVNKGTIQLVDLSGIDALLQLAKTPPYLATPTPTVTPTLPPTETPVPTETLPATSETGAPTESTPEVSATPEASPTATP